MDDFEKLSDIYKKQQEEYNEQKLIIEVDLAKTREEFRQMKTENEELKVKNDTLFKLGNIALKKNEKYYNKETNEDVIEVVEEDDVDTEDLEVLAKNKDNGFRRSGPTTPARKTNIPLYSQVVGAKHQPGPAGRQQHRQQAPPPREGQQDQAPQKGPRNSIRYCHYFNNGTCFFEEKYGRKCIFAHSKAPICKYAGNCNRKKCMFSHEKQQIQENREHFLGRRQPNTSLQSLLQQALETFLNNQQPAQQIRVWQRRPY